MLKGWLPRQAMEPSGGFQSLEKEAMSDPSRSVLAKSYGPAAFGVGGLLVGCAMTFAFLQRPSELRPGARYLQGPSSLPPAPVAPPTAVAIKTKPKPTTSSVPTDQPYDPLAGSLVVTKDQPALPNGWALKGVILPHAVDAPVVRPLMIPSPKPTWDLSKMRPSSAPPVTSKSSTAVVPTEPVVKKQSPLLPIGPSGTLDTIRISVADQGAAMSDLTAFVTKGAGFSQPFNEQLSDDRPIMKGLLILIPAKDAAGLLDHIDKLGSVLDQRHWVGLLTARADRIAKSDADRLAGLQSVRDDLLKTYKPDDLPVKQIEEELATASQTVEQLKLTRPTDGMAIVKVLFASPS